MNSVYKSSKLAGLEKTGYFRLDRAASSPIQIVQTGLGPKNRLFRASARFSRLISQANFFRAQYFRAGPSLDDLDTGLDAMREQRRDSS